MSDTNNSFAPAGSSSTTSGSPDATSSAAPTTTATLASFNVLHGRLTKGPVDLMTYVDEVKKLDADVLGLQEVDQGMLRTSRKDMARLAGEGAGMAHYFAKAARRIDFGRSGLAMLAKGPLSATTLKLPRLSWKNERRIAVEAKTQVLGVDWTVINTHLSLDGEESEKQLRFLLDRLANSSGPCVVMGDFNRLPEAVLPLLGDQWSAADSGPTWPAWGADKRIDYILVKNATVSSVEVRTTSISDHCALVAEVRPS